jgi:hypothetical protein
MFLRRVRRWRCFRGFGKASRKAMSLHQKPMNLLRRFARELGWSKLKEYQGLATYDASAKKKPHLITWYESGQAKGSATDFFLQINECPIGQTKNYCAAVYAIRYRICTPWRDFKLFRSETRIVNEAERLREWLQRDWFETPGKRKQFRALHPECVGYSWKQIRAVGLPVGDC